MSEWKFSEFMKRCVVSNAKSAAKNAAIQFAVGIAVSSITGVVVVPKMMTTKTPEASEDTTKKTV